MPDIVIIGGGIIGLCTAYYLLESRDLPHRARVTLIENTAIACASSSKAAGFVGGGKAWHAPGNQDLARLSFEAFTALAERFDGANAYGWRATRVTGVRVGAAGKMSAYRQLPQGKPAATAPGTRAPWANGEHVEFESDGKTAQLMPGDFCAVIHKHCTDRGLRTIFANPTGRTGHTVHTSAGDVHYDKLVIAAGPWAADLCTTLGLPRVPVGSLPGHSIQIRPGPLPEGYDSVPAQSLFCGVGVAEAEGSGGAEDMVADSAMEELDEWEKKEGWTRTIELFPRTDGLVYGAGENHVPASIGDAVIDARENRLPPTAASVPALVDEVLVARMLRGSKAVSSILDVDRGAQLVKADLCYRPVTADKMPILGKWHNSIFVASGHGPWGITLAPGSGVVVAEMVLADLVGKPAKVSADISGLSPFRFGPKAKL